MLLSYLSSICPGKESGWISLKIAPCIWRQTVCFWMKVIICRVQKRTLKDRHLGGQGAIFSYCSLNKQLPVERSGKQEGWIGPLRLKIISVGITFLDTIFLSRGLSVLRLTWKKKQGEGFKRTDLAGRPELWQSTPGRQSWLHRRHRGEGKRMLIRCILKGVMENQEMRAVLQR